MLYNNKTTTVKMIVNVTFARFEVGESIDPGHIEEIHEDGLIDSLGDIYDYEENCKVTKPFMMFMFAELELPTPQHEMKFITDDLHDLYSKQDSYRNDLLILQEFAKGHKNGCFAVIYDVTREDSVDYDGEHDSDFTWDIVGLLDTKKMDWFA